jgi:hypothetical protein
MHHFDEWPNAFCESQFPRIWFTDHFFPLIRLEEQRLLENMASNLLSGQEMFLLTNGESATWLGMAMRSLGGIVRDIYDDSKHGKLAETITRLGNCQGGIIVVSGRNLAMQAINISEMPIVNACIVRPLLVTYPMPLGSTPLIRRIAVSSALLQIIFAN